MRDRVNPRQKTKDKGPIRRKQVIIALARAAEDI